MKCLNLKCKGCVYSPCDPGFYGLECNRSCFSNCRALSCANCTCEVCNFSSGYCTNGCVFGFYGNKCETSCPRNCRKTKGHHIKCDQILGFCSNGCQQGFHGNWCNSTCSNGCKESLCTMTNGSCVKGCAEGYSGDFCDIPVSRSRDNDYFTGALGGGFIIALWSAVIVGLIFIVWKRRLKNYSVFNRQTPIEDGSNLCPRKDNPRLHERGPLAIEQEEKIHITISDYSGENDFRLLEETIKTRNADSPEDCACFHTKSCERLVKSPIFKECVECDHIMTSGMHDVFAHCTNNEKTIQTRRALSEGDLREMSVL